MSKIKQAIEDGEWWTGLGERLGLGRLLGFTFKHSAIFIKDDLSVNIDGVMVEILIDLDKRLKEINNV